MSQFNRMNRNTCPGSYTRSGVVSNGKAVCPCCLRDIAVRSNSTIKGHPRP
jgi:hypothetical protein